MPSFKKIKEILSQLWDVLKVLSVLFLIVSTIISALVWFGVNVFFPNSLAIEITKYTLIVLIPSTISTIILQGYRRSIEKKIRALDEEVTKIRELATQFQSFSDATQQIQNNLQYYNTVFSIPCLNQTCKKPISIPIPFSLVKEIHYVDGRPTGKALHGREMQITCEHCKEVFHIVYP